MLLRFVWCIFWAASIARAHGESCANHTNYMVPYEDGKISDPSGDGNCWTYKDHVAWHNQTNEDSFDDGGDIHASQYQCLASGCTDFYYGRIDLDLLEKCATHKCQVFHTHIERARNCSSQLIATSKLYDDIVVLKAQYNAMVQTNRSNVEFEKHDMLHGAQNGVEQTHSLLDDWELAVDDLTKLIAVKSPRTEIAALDNLQTDLDGAQDRMDNLRTQLPSLFSTVVTTKWQLQYLQDITTYGVSYSNALKHIKEHIDTLRDAIMTQYVYGSGTCEPLETLFEQISRHCVLCGEHGACKFVYKHFSCTCDNGWKGLTCSQPKQHCADDPCVHGGDCIDEFGSYRCECMSAWTGPRCEIPVNQSLGCDAVDDAHPCQHGATCDEGEDGYVCQCEFGWSGKNCQFSLKSCEVQNPCERGTCTFDNHRITCECPREGHYNQPFWVGESCSNAQMDCDYDAQSYHQGVLARGQPCSGHGLCTLNRAADAGENGWNCLCDDGYIGKRCETELNTIDSCVFANVLCIHGNCDSCQNATNCTCECDPGWTGPACNVEIDECQPDPCKNGAPCMDQLADFYCDCSKIPGQYGGTYCESKVTCAQQPCGDDERNNCNDEAHTTLSGIQCLCNKRWLGDRCEKDAEVCAHDTCFHGGQCLQGITAFCQCASGWTGDRCQNPPAFCDNDPCGSTGTCVLNENGYTCACQPGWEGVNCNLEIDECASHPCQHEGACIDKINDYTCICESGRSGRNCEHLITPCDTVSCPAHGLCVDTRLANWTTNTYECFCPSNTCRDTSSGRGKKNTYYGTVIGLASAALVITGLVVQRRCHSRGARKKRTQFTPTRLFETI